MEINAEIYRKAMLKLKENRDMEDYINVCLEAKVCPECGGDLKAYRQGTSQPPVLWFSCLACSFTRKEARIPNSVKFPGELGFVGAGGNTTGIKESPKSDKAAGGEDTSFPTDEPPVRETKKKKEAKKAAEVLTVDRDKAHTI